MIRSKLIALPLALALASPADAGLFHRRRACRPCAPRPACQPRQAAPGFLSVPPAASYAPTPQAGRQASYAPAAGGSSGESTGSFITWLNAYRRSAGLGPVAYDANLSGWAASNNGQQQARGMGHHVMGPARRQNSGWGSLDAVSAMWAASPAHQAALLDPSITRIGIAGDGAYWTFSAY